MERRGRGEEAGVRARGARRRRFEGIRFIFDLGEGGGRKKREKVQERERKGRSFVCGKENKRMMKGDETTSKKKKK